MTLEIWSDVTSEWVDITPYIAYQGISFSRNDVDSPNAGRDMSGYMHRGRVSSKEKIEVKTVQIDNETAQFLSELLYPETINVRVTPLPRTGEQAVLSMYSNNVKTNYVICRGDYDLLSMTFPLVEN